MSKWLNEVINAASENKTILEKDSLKADLATEERVLENLLREKGYVKLYSTVLEKEIYLARDDLEAEKLGKRLQSKSKPDFTVIYTMPEVGELIKEIKVSREGLKQIHEAKEILGSSSSTLFHGKGPMLE